MSDEQTAHPTAGETAAEIRLREAAEWNRSHAPESAEAFDMGREALALMRVFQHGPSGESWEEWLANVDALLARARGAA